MDSGKYPSPSSDDRKASSSKKASGRSSRAELIPVAPSEISVPKSSFHDGTTFGSKNVHSNFPLFQPNITSHRHCNIAPRSGSLIQETLSVPRVTNEKINNHAKRTLCELASPSTQHSLPVTYIDERGMKNSSAAVGRMSKQSEHTVRGTSSSIFPSLPVFNISSLWRQSTAVAFKIDRKSGKETSPTSILPTHPILGFREQRMQRSSVAHGRVLKQPRQNAVDSQTSSKNLLLPNFKSLNAMVRGSSDSNHPLAITSSTGLVPSVTPIRVVGPTDRVKLTHQVARAKPKSRFWETVLCHNRTGNPFTARVERQLRFPGITKSHGPHTTRKGHPQGNSDLPSSYSSRCVPSNKTQVPHNLKPANVTSTRTLSYMVREDIKNRPFGCERCPSRFTIKAHLKQHIRYVHDKVRPHPCFFTGCTVRFGTQFARNQHMWTVHEGKKPFPCTYHGCMSRFGQRSHLNRHYKRHMEKKEAATKRRMKSQDVASRSKDTGISRAGPSRS